ncbi:hypothetical protein BDZ89DRAFT_762437 [Hymenopellis radicata]|nr:hypothetical protein BDZ89DRAFT_762437 [Hymenopellis radicata]
MFRSNSDSTTTVSSLTPISPFSNDSVPSEPTSDGRWLWTLYPAVCLIFRQNSQILAHLRRIEGMDPSSAFQETINPPASPASTTNPPTTSESSSVTPSDHPHSELDSDADIHPDGSTVWTQKRILSYLKSGDTETETDQDDVYHGPEDSSRREEYDSSDTEGDLQYRTVYIADGSDELEVQSSRGTEGVDLDLIHDDSDHVVPTLGFQEALSFLADERERLTAQRGSGPAYNGRLMSLAAASGS